MTTPVVLQGSTAPVVLQHAPTPVVIKKDDGTALVVQTKETTVVVAVAKQGPPGRDGDTAGGALLVLNHLSEFDTEPKKVEARMNLGLQYIDGGTFF